MATRIREASNLDRDAVCDIHLGAFPDGENRSVAALAASLLEERTKPGPLMLIAEIDGEPAAHVAFSPLTARGDAGWLGYILSPLGVKPAWQKRGLGARLVEAGLERLAERGVHLVFVYGDPAYYGRFGFSVEAARAFVPPFELTYPSGWQATVLHERPLNEPAVALSCVRALRDPTLW